MTLYEHLRELRYRLVVASLAIIAGMVFSAFFYNQLFELLRTPVRRGIADLRASNPDAVTDLVNIGLASPFTLALKTCAVAGAVLTAPDLAVPAVGVRRARPAGQGEEVGADLHRHGDPAVPPRHRHRLLRTAEGDLGAARLHPGGRVQPAGHQHLPVLHAPADDRLRRRLPDPAAGADAQHRRCGQGQAAREVPHAGDLRHLRVRRRRHPIHRPVLDAGARPADEPAVPGRRGDRAHPGPAQEPAARDRRGRAQRGRRPRSA